MKKLRVLLVSSASLLLVKMCLLTSTAVLFSGCSKSTSDTSTSHVTTTAEPYNGLTLADNDTTYIETSGAGCTLGKASPYSTLLFQSSLLAVFPIGLSFTATGPASGIGAYKYTPIDSSSVALSGHPFYFTESFPGGESYKIDSIMVNITTAQNDTVRGTFTIVVSNTSRSKTVTGAINCDNAYIY